MNFYELLGKYTDARTNPRIGIVTVNKHEKVIPDIKNTITIEHTQDKKDRFGGRIHIALAVFRDHEKMTVSVKAFEDIEERDFKTYHLQLLSFANDAMYGMRFFQNESLTHPVFSLPLYRGSMDDRFLDGPNRGKEPPVLSTKWVHNINQIVVRKNAYYSIASIKERTDASPEYASVADIRFLRAMFDKILLEKKIFNFKAIRTRNLSGPWPNLRHADILCLDDIDIEKTLVTLRKLIDNKEPLPDIPISNIASYLEPKEHNAIKEAQPLKDQPNDTSRLLFSYRLFSETRYQAFCNASEDDENVFMAKSFLKLD